MDPRKRLVVILGALEGSSDAKRRKQFEDELRIPFALPEAIIAGVTRAGA